MTRSEIGQTSNAAVVRISSRRGKGAHAMIIGAAATQANRVMLLPTAPGTSRNSGKARSTIPAAIRTRGPRQKTSTAMQQQPAGIASVTRNGIVPVSGNISAIVAPRANRAEAPRVASRRREGTVRKTATRMHPRNSAASGLAK
jgi:hypothetical protein